MTIRTQRLLGKSAILWMATLAAADPQVSPRASGPQSAPSVGSLVEAGERTQKRLAAESCSWRSTIELDAGPRIEVEVLYTPQVRRTVISANALGKSQEVYRIIERDGLQYVRQLGKPLGKFRPYEAPLCSPGFQLFIELAEPFVVTDETLHGATWERTSGDVASYRVQVPEERAAIPQHG